MNDNVAGYDRSIPDRLYQDLARRLIAELASGRYAVGDRLRAEGALSVQHNVSRPTVRNLPIPPVSPGRW